MLGDYVKMFWGNVSLKLKKLVQGVYEMVQEVYEMVQGVYEMVQGVYGQIWLIYHLDRLVQGVYGIGPGQI